jgi:hypothetical protein
MNKKIFVITALVVTVLIASATISVTSETTEEGSLGRTRLIAIGRNFHICPDDGGLYGHIFMGLDGLKPVFFKNIHIPEESLRVIIITNHFVYCSYKE